MKIKQGLITVGCALSLSTAIAISAAEAAPNPASQDWVKEQIERATVLSKFDWAAVCSTGSPTTSTGCYGDVSSKAFANLSRRLGGYTTYANIYPQPVAGSVFVKAFLAGTNTPANTGHLSVTVASTARCALFTQAGLGINGPQGIAADTPISGSWTFGGPTAPHVYSINNVTTSPIEVTYNDNSGGSGVTLNVPYPIYFLCVGYSPTDGSTATTILNTVTAS